MCYNDIPCYPTFLCVLSELGQTVENKANAEVYRPGIDLLSAGKNH